MQDTVQRALNARANSYMGTANQRQGFLSAPAGTRWQDTDGTRFQYVKGDQDWVRAFGTVELWSGSPIHLNGNQSVQLSEPLSRQPTGITLVWQEYVNGAAANSSWGYTFIPKSHNLGGGVACALTHFNGTFIRKYVYVDQQQLRGHNNNNTSPASTLVLSRVLGL